MEFLLFLACALLNMAVFWFSGYFYGRAAMCTEILAKMHDDNSRSN